MSVPLLTWAEKARQLRAEGRTTSEIALALGRDPSAVRKAIKRVPYSTPVFIVGTDIQIPYWVQKADLINDFRDIARASDEFAAASHCRALLREMRAS